ncbi:nitroreductase family protein [Pontiella agarivorans]|uniref:Nitroreductase family protein n=1 Tax=Pontiella agarivorans TaxID=3038953 RepID=A0ABU5MZ66_9BACT|nr:nitroreductase family protein [Pontiella agarivorans]MDZ8119496.1 nitroreductase family protein [Pontiella agarivorans]
MKKTVQELLESRVSTGKFDPSRKLEADVLQELVRLATRAPSAFNLQNWHFIAIQSDEARELLHPLAYNQPQILAASAVFIVCGELDAHERLHETLQPSVEAGMITDAIRETWVEMAKASYGENEQARRDEAIRSASLAAMSLMVAAEGMGLASGAMGGFDPAGVMDAFGLDPARLPVMLVAVGHAAEGNWPQKQRRATEEVLEFR